MCTQFQNFKTTQAIFFVNNKAGFLFDFFNTGKIDKTSFLSSFLAAPAEILSVTCGRGKNTRYKYNVELVMPEIGPQYTSH
jgi:hypothetical protein